MTKAELLERLEIELLSGWPKPYRRPFDGAALIHECLEAEKDIAARGGEPLTRRGRRLRAVA